MTTETEEFSITGERMERKKKEKECIRGTGPVVHRKEDVMVQVRKGSIFREKIEVNCGREGRSSTKGGVG